jgi:Raf kinase inhibitor-like YbhB/YbcL family protein
MKSLTLLASLTAFLSACAARPDVGPAGTADPLPLQDQVAAPASLVVTSSDFEDGGPLDVRFSFDQFGCIGNNDKPQLAWSGAPAQTQSFAIIVHDPDAPTGVGFFHWVAINLPASTTHVDESLPNGALELHTDYGGPGYGGPCPPPGPEHRYVFSVYALDVPRLDLPEGATGALTRFMLREHAIATGRIVGTFSR